MIGRQASAPSHPSLPSRPENSTADHAESSKRIAPRILFTNSRKIFLLFFTTSQIFVNPLGTRILQALDIIGVLLDEHNGMDAAVLRFTSRVGKPPTRAQG
jgi:hypothetical protein